MDQNYTPGIVVPGAPTKEDRISGIFQQALILWGEILIPFSVLATYFRGFTVF
jgi:hypothetical protein